MYYLHKNDFELVITLLKESIREEEIIEIRQIRVFLETKNFLIKKSPIFIVFFSNDWIDFDSFGKRDNAIIFFTIRLKNKSIYVIGIQEEFFKNGKKKETLIYNKKISCWLYKLLINKYNMIWRL